MYYVQGETMEDRPPPGGRARLFLPLARVPGGWSRSASSSLGRLPGGGRPGSARISSRCARAPRRSTRPRQVASVPPPRTWSIHRGPGRRRARAEVLRAWKPVSRGPPRRRARWVGRVADAGGVNVGVLGAPPCRRSAPPASRSVPGLTVVQLNGARLVRGAQCRRGALRCACRWGARFLSRCRPSTMWPRVYAMVGAPGQVYPQWRGARAWPSSASAPSMPSTGLCPSQVCWAGGHLTARDQTVLRRQNVVGTCAPSCCAPTARRDVTLNARATSPTAQLSPDSASPVRGRGTGKSRRPAGRAARSTATISSSTTCHRPRRPGARRGPRGADRVRLPDESRTWQDVGPGSRRLLTAPTSSVEHRLRGPIDQN